MSTTFGYDPAPSAGARGDDPMLSIPWPHGLSEEDRALPFLDASEAAS